MSVHTYNPSVRVGNWNEDLCLEEDLLKDFLAKKENGELMIHKSHDLAGKLMQSVTLDIHQDGHIHYGDKVCLHNLSTEENLSIHLTEDSLHYDKCVSAPCGVVSSKILSPCYRNTFVVRSPDGCKQDGQYLNFGEHFLLCTLPEVAGDLKLASDTATLMKNAKKSRLQEVALTSQVSYLCHWQILHFDPQQRFESEGTPVPANQKIMLNHCKTNQRVASLPDYVFRTSFGREHEIVAHTFLDSHKAEKKENWWMIIAYDNAKEG